MKNNLKKSFNVLMPRVIEKSISFDVKRNEGQKYHIDSQRHLAVM